jgi:DNA mismatch repair protein MSH6
LISLGNFEIYDPIRKATSLVLDGKTLINLEIFNNAFDGSVQGTLFALLNRCITPFGKRMLRQWVCHPLADADRINARLDTVEALNADTSFRDAFSGQLQRLPDLERLISRVHAGTSRAVDFCRVLEGFEQINDAMNQLRQHGEGEGLIGKLLDSLPDLEKLLTPWYTAFDRLKAKDDGVMVPEPGVEEDFDASQETIEKLIAELTTMIKSYQKEYKYVYCLPVQGVRILTEKTAAKISASEIMARRFIPSRFQ